MSQIKINILYVLIELFSGGMENGIVNLINHSSEHFNHIICCLRKKGAFANRIRRTNVRYYECNMRYGNDYTLPFKISKIIQEERIHLVRCFNEDPYFYSFMPSKVLGIPIIYYNGGRTLPEITRRVIIERILGNFASRVVVPSTELKRYLSDIIGITSNIIEVIRNGVDTTRFQSDRINSYEIRSSLHIPQNNIIIGTIGRLVEQKDLKTFLRIAEKVLSRKQDYTFLIVGEGVLKRELMDFAEELSLSSKVHFLGYRDDIEDVLKAFDIFLLTSRWEGLSNVVLEAMASGKMVISTDVEGSRSLIDDGINGYIVEVGDIDGFAERILSTDNEIMCQIGNNAFRKVGDSFSIERMVEAYENLYLRLLS